jgi:hypothetical protein
MNQAARLPSLLHGMQASPMMAGALVALFLFDFIGIFVLGVAFFPLERADPDIRADWRPPTLTQYQALASKPENADVQTLTRPIFSKTRKPFSSKEKKTPAAGLASAPVTPSSGLTLSAVATYHKSRRAFLVSAATPKGRWCAVGDDIDGWNVMQVQNLEVVLRSGERTVRLTLYPEPQK